MVPFLGIFSFCVSLCTTLYPRVGSVSGMVSKAFTSSAIAKPHFFFFTGNIWLELIGLRVHSSANILMFPVMKSHLWRERAVFVSLFHVLVIVDYHAHIKIKKICFQQAHVQCFFFFFSFLNSNYLQYIFCCCFFSHFFLLYMVLNLVFEL